MLSVFLRIQSVVLATVTVAAATAPNIPAVVARADLDYATPATRSEEGMPVGNGRMGSLVWTAPTALKFQINRVDVFAMHASSVSFPRADSDYAAGCGYVDVNLASAGGDVFVGADFHQHLSL
ncbi:MAG TPA: glycoside hydrolase N-terminal domain-containing protein, partial [Lacunisphaera sp.]